MDFVYLGLKIFSKISCFKKQKNNPPKHVRPNIPPSISVPGVQTPPQ